jgi:hypothetical protein
MSKLNKARTVTIVQDGTAKSWSKKQSTKKVFPVEVTYKEPSTDLGLLIEYEASLANRQPVGPKGGKLKKKKRSRPHKVNGVRPTSG